MIRLLRALSSEWLKFRRWTLLAGVGAMIAASAFLSYLTFHQITTGATGREIDPLSHAFLTSQGLISVVGQVRSLVIAIVLIMVTANVAAEWSQGTWRNLLVREPDRVRLLAGKVIAIVAFVLLAAGLALGASLALVFALANAQGILTAAWTSAEGARWALLFLGNEALCLTGISLLGVLIAVLSRSVGTAVGVALAYVLVPEGIVAMVWSEGSRWFPVRVFNFLPGSAVPADVGPNAPQGYLAALVVALLWMGVFTLGSFVAFRRQDILA